ncbi:hypothetical protein AMJ85_09940 [candidate division BRC1 bacterium SM23_51]|nr:MAG: hypothetical protein AMJ85_09940 [candidate division BRC1 bacterium SM23_51]
MRLQSQKGRASTSDQGIIFDIKRYAIHDGPGIRVTVFLKGCPLRCLWCHNPEGQSPEPETMIPRASGESPSFNSEDEKAGRVMTVNEVMAEIEKDILFLDQSGGGATFSGGEPLMQPGFLTSLLQACREKDIHTVVDTCGYAPSDVFNSIAANVDLFLFDLKLLDDAEHENYTGASNRPILQNLTQLDEMGKRVIIRFPVVPQVTDTEENITNVVSFLSSLRTMRDVALLPYHNLGGQKYERLRRKDGMQGMESPASEGISRIQSLFESQGLRVTIGG